MSHLNSTKASLVQIDAPVVDAIAPKEFEGGHYDLWLLPLYAGHITIHVWDRKVKCICIYSLKQIYYNIWTFWR